MYTVYQHVNKINNKIYIGITKQNPEDRWGKNGANYKSSPHFYSAIEKYGWDNFEHNILFENLSKEEACLKEQELIALYNSMDNECGYNNTSGGEMCIMSDLSKSKLSNSMKGNKNGLGHPCSEEKKLKISEAQKGKRLTEEHKKKLSISAQNRHVPCSDDKRKILSQNYPHKKTVYCYETNTIYESVQECARQLKLYPTNVTKVCKNIIHTTGGYHLEYYNDTINV